jgi:hypothetical protein
MFGLRMRRWHEAALTWVKVHPRRREMMMPIASGPILA